MMYAVIYHFKVKENKEAQFIESWKELTQLIYKYEGSLGSRLHKKSENDYIAYAQWPNKQVWEDSGNKLPESANEVRNIMRDSCWKLEKLYELDCIEDMLK